MRQPKNLSVIALLVMTMLGIHLGSAQGNDWTSQRLGLQPLKSDFMNLPQYSHLGAMTNMAAAQGSTAGGPGEGGKLDLEELSKKMDNPLGSLWILWIQNDTITIKGFPLRKTQTINNTLFQPILPVPLTKDWIWVNRPVLSFMSVPTPNLPSTGQGEFPGLFPGGGPGFSGIPGNVSTDRKYEFGDLIYMGMLAPAELPDVGNGKLIWGLGPTFIFPTATNSSLGSQKWSIGPAGLLMYMDPAIKAGFIAQQWFSYAGKDNRPDVSKANIQPILYYSLPHLWQIGTSPNILVNWEGSRGNRWTVPIGGGVNKTTLLFDKLPVRFEANVYYAALRPDDVGQRWDFRLLVIPVVPNLLKVMGVESLF